MKLGVLKREIVDVVNTVYAKEWMNDDKNQQYI
jgi:hypothetical protein